jgi:2-C-methyl-D-erythritol 2,4-cyclodiphosphate synthase
VPHDRNLVGHSDADVLLHAVTDAILGAAALPDIGRMFPNTDEVNRGRDSADMLTAAAAKVAETGYSIVNLDCIVHAERPKLTHYHDAIRHRIAGILRLNPNQIGLKAKTGEGIGPVGQQEIIEARCIALLERQNDQGPNPNDQPR